jgi:RNA polymerase sigma factor (sigma-70 family)
MNHRQDLVAMFSTFMIWEDGIPKSWQEDLRLHHSMDVCLRNSTAPLDPQNPPSELPCFWALYWHREYLQWQSISRLGSSACRYRLSQDHLFAYAQEAAYWAAFQIGQKVKHSQHSLVDLFQLATLEIPLVLQGFQPQRAVNLAAYAQMVMARRLRDILRQAREADLSSPWGLLRKTSRKRVTEVLQGLGMGPDLTAQQVLVWSLFVERYVPRSPRGEMVSSQQVSTQNPDHVTFWEQLAQDYQQAQRERALSFSNALAVSPEQLKNWMTHLAKGIQAYLYPQVGSINVPTHNDPNLELKDQLSDLGQLKNIDTLVELEELEMRIQQYQQVRQVLTTSLLALLPERQTLLAQYYGQRLTQKQIAEGFGETQVWVSRNLSRARTALLKALVHWAEQKLNISVTPNQLMDQSVVLEAWLTEYYQQQSGRP